MNAEEFLADLETKAREARDAKEKYEHWTGVPGDGFFLAANPAAVLRLVDMVRNLALGASNDCPRPAPKCREDGDCSRCWIDAVYQQTEPK